MNKEWKPVVGYEGLYEISNNGEILSKTRRKILKQNNSKGYNRVILSKDGKPQHFLVHRLVAIAFLPNPHNLPQINHKDENKLNNNVENLEWCDAKYNINYGNHNQKLSISKKDWWKDDAKRQWMSESKKGEKNPNYRKKYTEEEREKISKRLNKKVYQYTIDGVLVAEYESVKEAATINGYDRGNLSKACRGIIRYGYKWSYERL